MGFPHTGAEARSPARLTGRAVVSARHAEFDVERDLLAGSTFRFADRGTHGLKGLSEAWQLYAVA